MDIQITPILDSLKLEKIDDTTYFSEKYSEYISNSRLSLINPDQDNNPKAFFEGLSKHNKYSDSLILGSAVHELVLQPELFHLCGIVNRPTSKAGFMADELYEDYLNDNINPKTVIAASDKVNYYKGRMNDKKIETLIQSCSEYWKGRKEYELHKHPTEPIYLDGKAREKVLRCVDAIKQNKYIQDLLHPEGIITPPISENEQAILLDVNVSVPNYEPFILKLKAKLDNYTIDAETNTVTVNDVKTIGKIVSEFKTNFEVFHYYRELAIYSWLLSLAVKKYYNMDKCTIKSNCLVVSTIPDYYTKIYEVTKKDFMKGWNEFVKLLKLVAYYYYKGYRFT